jgi:RHS repeat-associated protein
MFNKSFKAILLFTLLLLATVINAAQTVTFFHNDISGSPLMATDAGGNVIWKENYYPYGERLKNQEGQQVASINNKLWFTGKPHDKDTGLSYFGARYYNPMLGRFMGIDPEDFNPDNIHSFNRYAYANNNPYRFVDPDGHSPLDIGFLVYDIGKAAAAIYSGQGVGMALADVAMSAIGVVSPIPGTGQALKAAKIANSSQNWVGVASAALKTDNIARNATRSVSKSLKDQAIDIIPLNSNKHRVTLHSPSQKMELDLAGRDHGGVPTPHVKISLRNLKAPEQPSYNTKNSPVVSATQQDVRTARRFLERKNINE